MLVFVERGKLEYPEKNLSEQRPEPTTNSTHILRRVQESNPGHIGGRKVLSPLRHPCSPIYEWKENVQRNAQLYFRWKGKNSSYEIFPSRTSSLCSAAKQKHFVNRKVVNHNFDKRKLETNQCEELTTSELQVESRADHLQRTRSAHRLSSQHLAAVPTPNIAELVPSRS